jgi:serpin B
MRLPLLLARPFLLACFLSAPVLSAQTRAPARAPVALPAPPSGWREAGGGAVVGVVADSLGRPIPDATVRFVRAGRVARGDSLGRFAIAGLPAGADTAETVHLAFDVVRSPVRIRTGTLETLRVRLRENDLFGSSFFREDLPPPQCVADTATGRVPEGLYDAFSFRLAGALAGREPDANLFVSPVSAAFALAVASEAAEGATRDEIRAALTGAPMPDPAFLAANHAAKRSLDQCSSVELAVANALWVRREIPLRPAFVTTSRDAFDATAETVDFAAPATADRIDAWASRHTRGRIRSIAARPMDTTTALIITNAVYMKGRWATPFPADATRPAPFRRADGSSVTVPSMHVRGDFLHFAGNGYAVLRLPYAGDRVSMSVVLPDSGVALGEVRARMSAPWWDSVAAGSVMREARVWLPRFRLEQTLDLVPALHALGVRTAFMPRAADFSRGLVLDRTPLGRAHVGSVAQKTFVEVNEEGTEAAAVTAISLLIPTGVIVRPEPVVFRVDRPFLLLIRDEATGLPLFLGQVTDPTASSP